MSHANSYCDSQVSTKSSKSGKSSKSRNDRVAFSKCHVDVSKEDALNTVTLESLGASEEYCSPRSSNYPTCIISPSDNCDGEFTTSGQGPAKTAGPLTNCHTFAKYAPCGHWDNCKKVGCRDKKYFKACNTCPTTSPYGPYGPWSKKGPAKFLSPRHEYLEVVFPSRRLMKNGLKCKPDQPMGNLAPWPLSGSCRFAGRPYGPCRPFGAYKSRGPFGVWNCKTWTECCRPPTPRQPCWMPAKRGHRPCTPCHRPLFRPCTQECEQLTDPVKLCK